MIEKMPQFNIGDLEFSRGPYRREGAGRRFQIGDFFFTTKELEVLILVKQEIPLSQIAKKLGLSYKGVSNRLSYLKKANQKDPFKHPPTTATILYKAEDLELLNPIVLVALKGLDKKYS